MTEELEWTTITKEESTWPINFREFFLDSLHPRNLYFRNKEHFFDAESNVNVPLNAFWKLIGQQWIYHKKFWTDYPVLALGDVSGKLAPMRHVFINSYDGDKYCACTVEGVDVEIKTGYIYTRANLRDIKRFEE